MSLVTALSADDIEAGRRLFAEGWDFARGTPDLDHLPPDDRPEIAFAGRSNVGKSSLINALVDHHRLARHSNTPGRTQELNFFAPPLTRVYMVDMPGYGYAEAPKEKIAAWNAVLRGYLAGRRTLLRTFVLIDARHGIKPGDREIMDLLDSAAVSYQAVLTKIDKIGPLAVPKVLGSVADGIRKNAAAFPEVLATSSEKGTGIPELRATIAKLLVAQVA